MIQARNHLVVGEGGAQRVAGKLDLMRLVGVEPQSGVVGGLAVGAPRKGQVRLDRGPFPGVVRAAGTRAGVYERDMGRGALGRRRRNQRAAA